jgi:hypothetical protein
MKKILPLLLLSAGWIQLNAQAILNEVYAFPGGSRHEFYEFYNNSNFTVSMDNYTLVTYYQEGAKDGFFVMDIPNLPVAPRGFFVGSSAVPFNYQGVTNSTMSQYSWNDLAFMAANNGYLKKWVRGTSIPAAIDGNANYDLTPIPADFNDVFQKIGGGGATYNVFVYRNGVLMNIFLGGTGGDTFIPTYITSLPSLYVDMSASAPDFNINFSGYANARTEYVIQDIGSDNGYIRLRDGFCGTWTKSSSQVTHSPGVTNGGDPDLAQALVSVSSVIVRGNAVTGSTVNYDVVAANIIEFPVTLNVYVDNGTVPGQIDAGDTYIDTKIENAVTDGPFSTVFFPYTANILIQTVTSAGCIDNEQMIPNAGILPVRMTSFQAINRESSVELKWSVAQNENGKEFQIEKSTDGKTFFSVATVPASVKTGSENYAYNDAGVSVNTFYRVKLVDRNTQPSYSNTLMIAKKTTHGFLSLNQNPVDSYLGFSVNANGNTMGTVNIYNAAGTKMVSQKINLTKGTNSITLNLDGKIYTGMYILEVLSNQETQSVKFLKR